jgi:hypothetical protein
MTTVPAKLGGSEKTKSPERESELFVKATVSVNQHQTNSTCVV